MQFWKVISSALGSAALVSAAIAVTAYLMKGLFAQMLSRDLERFRADLQRAAYEHQVRFSKLHEKRADVIAELYARLDRTEKALGAMTAIFIPAGEPSTEEKAEEFVSEANGFINYFGENRIYLEQTACVMIDQFIASVRQTNLNWRFGLFDSLSPENREKYWNAQKEAVTKLPGIRSEIERQFRSILGGAASGGSSEGGGPP